MSVQVGSYSSTKVAASSPSGISVSMVDSSPEVTIIYHSANSTASSRRGIATASSATQFCGTKDVTTTIATSELYQFTLCPTWMGSIALGSDFPVEKPPSGVNLEIEEIVGDLIIENATLFGYIASNTLRSIGGTFYLANLWESETVNVSTTPICFPNLTSVDNFTVFNVSLTSLEEIGILSAGSIQILSNPHLEYVNMPLQSVDTNLRVDKNNPQLSIDLGNLTSASSLEFVNISSINLLSLNTVSKSFSLVESSATNLSLGNLSYVGLALNIRGNTQLQAVDLGNLVLANSINLTNSNLLKTLAFPALSTVGNITINEDVISLETPSLRNISGMLNITSMDTAFNCSRYGSTLAKAVVDGHYTCQSGIKETNTTTPGTSRNESDGSRVSVLGLKIGVSMSVCIVVALVAGIGYWILKRRRMRRAGSGGGESKKSDKGMAEVELNDTMGDYRKAELPAAGNERLELPGEHGVTEASTNGLEESHELPASS